MKIKFFKRTNGEDVEVSLNYVLRQISPNWKRLFEEMVVSNDPKFSVEQRSYLDELLKYIILAAFSYDFHWSGNIPTHWDGHIPLETMGEFLVDVTDEGLRGDTYIPSPPDTSDVPVSEEIAAMSEKLAENAHEEWALGRIKEGWNYGEWRDDKTKTHPCLVPYDKLPESEKEYDRKTAMSTVKLILGMGYDIVRKP